MTLLTWIYISLFKASYISIWEFKHIRIYNLTSGRTSSTFWKINSLSHLTLLHSKPILFTLRYLQLLAPFMTFIFLNNVHTYIYLWLHLCHKINYNCFAKTTVHLHTRQSVSFIWFWNMCKSPVWYSVGSFHFIYGFLCCAKLLFYFIFITLGDRLKNILLEFISKSVLPMFSSKNFIVSGLTFRSLIHFEFIFVYGIKECSNFIFCHVAFSFHSTIYWRNHLLSIL